ncbi:MFS transporter [Microbulbifer sp. ZKSA006]|uniref:MFS transporter n=1 Tax=Microbulbifer sp. ZKSA006 TaxID=3243390 RepID=UPI00403A23B0
MKKTSEPNFHYLSYALTAVSYMTLMLSMPLSDTIANSLQVKVSQVHLGISTLYLMFSISAIVLSMLSDIFSAERVLKYAQLMSIAGLFTIANSHSLSIFHLGCALVGGGTGCYSSVGRSVMLRHSNSPATIKKRTSFISLTVIVAPILSSILARTFIPIDWRIAYYIMITVEAVTLVVSQLVLRRDQQPLLALNTILKVWKQCLTTKTCMLNMLSTGAGYALVMQTIIGNIHGILKHAATLSYAQMNLVVSGLSVTYILGIFTFRALVNSDKLPTLRLLITLFIPLTTFIFSQYHSDLFPLLSSLYLCCFVVGFLNPLSSSFAMADIKAGHGMASALLTFSFAFISAIYSFTQGYLEIAPIQFTTLSMIFSFSFLFILAIALRYKKF